jgi:hypothetical protein
MGKTKLKGVMHSYLYIDKVDRVLTRTGTAAANLRPRRARLRIEQQQRSSHHVEPQRHSRVAPLASQRGRACLVPAPPLPKLPSLAFPRRRHSSERAAVTRHRAAAATRVRDHQVGSIWTVYILVLYKVAPLEVLQSYNDISSSCVFVMAYVQLVDFGVA